MKKYFNKINNRVLNLRFKMLEKKGAETPEYLGMIILSIVIIGILIASFTPIIQDVWMPAIKNKMLEFLS